MRISRFTMLPVLMTCLLGVATTGLLTSCNSAPQSTRLRASDFDETIAKMAQSLAASDFLASRDAQSPAAWVVIDKVENLTTDIIAPAEQWMLVARLQSSLPIRSLAEKKNVRFQITPERHALLRQAGYEGELGTPPKVTHTLAAVFLAAPRTNRTANRGQVSDRADFYYLEYSLLDLDTRQIVWSDTFEIRRQARGLAID